MFVCHCRAVTDGTVQACIKAGACSLSDLADRCGAGSRCGGCHLVLRQLLAAALPEATIAAFDPCAA